MKTFLEVNETLVSFVNYKLYFEQGLVYPPPLDTEKVNTGTGLGSIVLQNQNQVSVQMSKKQIKKKLKTLNMDALQNEDEVESEGEGEMDVDEESEKEEPRLFSKCYFWISREVPRYSVEFVIKSLGGQCGWDVSCGGGSPFDIDDSRITHVLTDRPTIVDRKEGREYLQPQWIYDCVNQEKMVKTAGYHPGESLPPHLSPFVQLDEDEYDPEKDAEVFFVNEMEKEVEEQDSDVEVKEDDAKELAKIMMSRREKKLYDKIQFGKKRKQEETKKLKQKRVALAQ
jgi:pescadillo protein